MITTKLIWTDIHICTCVFSVISKILVQKLKTIIFVTFYLFSLSFFFKEKNLENFIKTISFISSKKKNAFYLTCIYGLVLHKYIFENECLINGT